VLLLLLLTPLPGWSAAPSVTPKGQAFASPEAAVTALVEAARKAEPQAILAILGEDAKDLVFSGDSVDGKQEAANFVVGYEEFHALQKDASGKRVVLVLGEEKWPFPIPVIEVGGKWYFDVASGREELLFRRIGRNELTAIQVMQAYVNAQLEYAAKDRDGDGVLEYAQKIKSDPGKQNGLYWPIAEGEDPSPFGPLVAQAETEGYDKDKGEMQPYHGYYFRIVTRQGKNAPGGAYDYVVNGNMVLGFGMIAWPAKYGISGIMTFAVNQAGVIYQCDLGPETDKIIREIVKYNPDEHVWVKVSEQDLQ
jgi:hypothetical protein